MRPWEPLQSLNSLSVTQIAELSKFSKSYISQVKHGKCPPSAKLLEVLKSHHHRIQTELSDDYRRFIQIPRRTKRWKQIYNRRTSMERIFSRQKKDRDAKLVNHRIRGLDKITLNCLLSIWVMQARIDK